MGQPREVNIDMFSRPEELLESVEELQYTVEEVQSFYADCEKRNQELQQQLIEKEKEFNRRIQALNEELSTVRHTKVRIARENIMKECPVTPRWFIALTKSVEQEKRIADLNSKINELKVEVMEKNKTISSLQHRLKDSEATIAVLTSDRNRMAVEVDELASRLDEFEYGNTFRKVDSASCRTETNRFNSCNDETVHVSSMNSSAHSRTSHDNDRSGGFVPLKRAANFNNINSLDESADFKLEEQNYTSSVKLAGSNRSEIMVENSGPTTSFKAGEPSEIAHEKEDIACRTNVGNEIDEKDQSVNGLSVLHKDTSWERFDRSGSHNALSSLGNNELGRVPPIFVDDDIKSDAFKESDESSQFTRLVKSTPVGKSDRSSVELESGSTAVKSGATDDPWISPGQSPIPDIKSRSASRNLFWEKNEDCTIYPFYIPDDNDENSSLENGHGSRPDISIKLPLRDFGEINESLKDNVDVVSPSSVPSNFSFDEKILSFDEERRASFDEESQKPMKFVIKKASKENLWDFEPDSIVDVSTGQTIYESMKKGDESPTSESESCIENGNDYQPKQDSNDLSCLEKYLPLDDHARSVSDLTSEMSEEKAQSLAKALDKRSSNHVDGKSHQKNREFVRKGTKKEREALKAYMQWKHEGKQGVPPANFKISLC